jgi:hypothetical protein
MFKPVLGALIEGRLELSFIVHEHFVLFLKETFPNCSTSLIPGNLKMQVIFL